MKKTEKINDKIPIQPHEKYVDGVYKQPVSITHLRMLHGALEQHDTSKGYFNHQPDFETNIRIAESQFKIGQVITKSNNSVVVYEGLCERIEDVSSYLDPKQVEKIQTLLSEPNLFNRDFDKLTQEQKMLLAEVDIGLILLSLKQIPCLYPSMDRDLYNTLLFEIQNSEKITVKKALSFNLVREESALQFCVNAAVVSGISNVLLVFGGAHDFNQYIGEDFVLQEPILCYTPKPLVNKISRMQDPEWESDWDLDAITQSVKPDKADPKEKELTNKHEKKSDKLKKISISIKDRFNKLKSRSNNPSDEEPQFKK